MAISDLLTTDSSLAGLAARPCIARLTGVSLAFGDGTRALDNFSLAVAPGECLGVLGPNGAGKTSLLRLLAGLLQLTAGHVELFGLPGRRESIAIRRRIGYVAQQSGIDEYLSGQGNLLLAGRLHGLGGDSLQQRARTLLEVVGLREHARRRAAHYSGGMRRRLALACSLVHQPDLLLLDEPTTGLDTAGKAALWSYLLALQQAGLTIIATSHDTQEIERYCGRVVLMDHGQSIMEGTPADLKRQLQGDVLTLELSEPQQAARALQVLQREPFIRSATQGDAEAQVRLEVMDGSEGIPQLARLLEAAGLSLRRLTLSRPTLEDVFFQATGKPLAERAASAGEPDAPLQKKKPRHGPPWRRSRQGEQR